MMMRLLLVALLVAGASARAHLHLHRAAKVPAPRLEADEDAADLFHMDEDEDVVSAAAPANDDDEDVVAAVEADNDDENDEIQAQDDDGEGDEGASFEEQNKINKVEADLHVLRSAVTSSSDMSAKDRKLALAELKSMETSVRSLEAHPNNKATVERNLKKTFASLKARLSSQGSAKPATAHRAARTLEEERVSAVANDLDSIEAAIPSSLRGTQLRAVKENIAQMREDLQHADVPRFKEALNLRFRALKAQLSGEGQTEAPTAAHHVTKARKADRHLEEDEKLSRVETDLNLVEAAIRKQHLPSARLAEIKDNIKGMRRDISEARTSEDPSRLHKALNIRMKALRLELEEVPEAKATKTTKAAKRTHSKPASKSTSKLTADIAALERALEEAELPSDVADRDQELVAALRKDTAQLKKGTLTARREKAVKADMKAKIAEIRESLLANEDGSD